MRISSSIQFGGTAALLAGTILLASLSERRIPEDLAVPLGQIPSHIDGWTEVGEQQLDPHTLKTLDATSYILRTLRKGDLEVSLFIAFYAQQRAGESMHSPKLCLPGTGWEIWRRDSAWVPVGEVRVRVNKYSIQNMGKRMLMFYWYQSQSRIVASEYVGKLLLARDALLTGQTAGTIVRVAVPDVPGADQIGVSFSAKIIPELQRCLGSPRRSMGRASS